VMLYRADGGSPDAVPDPIPATSGCQ
jgi:hypothetical protein